MSDLNTVGVTVENGKYTVKQDADGRLTALRYGEPWRDCCGDGLIYALAAEVESLRDLLVGGQAALPPKPGAVRWWPKCDERPQRGWWAPGEYMNTCHHCQGHFVGDKRAAWCADCAYASPEAVSTP